MYDTEGLSQQQQMILKNLRRRRARNQQRRRQNAHLSDDSLDEEVPETQDGQENRPPRGRGHTSIRARPGAATSPLPGRTRPAGIPAGYEDTYHRTNNFIQSEVEEHAIDNVKTVVEGRCIVGSCREHMLLHFQGSPCEINLYLKVVLLTERDCNSI